jgi:hypothetical protein
MNSQKKVAAFEKKMGWHRTASRNIAVWLKKDALLLNENNAKHKLVDIYFETIQMANREKLDIDKALVKHMKEAQKKYRKVK